MKVAKVIDICKSSGELYITQTKDAQWIGNSEAIYPLWEFPEVTIDDLCVLYEISQEKQDKMILNERKTEELPVDLSPLNGEEEAAEIVRVGITIGGTSYVILRHGRGISFIKRKYLEPFKEEIQIWRRASAQGEYFVISCGMFLNGIIIPERNTRADICTDIKEIAQAL